MSTITTERVCERHGCYEVFTPAPSKMTGPKAQRFCSKPCRLAENNGALVNWKPTSSGKIPADVFLPELREAAPGIDTSTLARRVNIKEDSLYKALGRDEIDFDLCDLILCKLGAVHRWWSGPLEDFYWTVPLV